MKTTIETVDDYTILHLRGELDTLHCEELQNQVDELINAGTDRLALNLRHVRFINSTALGTIIRASKALTEQGGMLVISHPSPPCRDVMDRVGLERAVLICDSDEDAGRAFIAGDLPELEFEATELEDPATVLFAPVDPARVDQFIPEERRDFKSGRVHRYKIRGNWRGVGRLRELDENGLGFLWDGGKSGLSAFEMCQLFALGTDVMVKFQLPLLQKGFCEARATVQAVEERDAGIKLQAAFEDIDSQTLEAVRQYATDMQFLKEELST